MNSMMTSQQSQAPEQGPQGAAAPARLTTTLYDVMATLQEVVDTDDDAVVVAVVVQWLQTGRLTLDRDVTVAA